jgi:hypothetical protein
MTLCLQEGNMDITTEEFWRHYILKTSAVKSVEEPKYL